WPGRGPFSFLPPWMRPGWVFGRGACWWLFGPWMWYTPYLYWWPYSYWYMPYYWYTPWLRYWWPYWW
ncbi:MAG: hypothetical protein DRN96_08440, partial [Thermoproteota archaeon]